MLDPVTLAVMANRVDTIAREMTNTMVRTARSTTMAVRDFSCSITTSEHELISAPDGIPVHVFGSSLLSESMARLHPDFEEGDAFLHNDPYDGNTHAADYTILVPVFFEGEHVFTAQAKAHQIDCGNGLPTTYMPFARDVYEEGALIFPCVHVHRGYEEVADVIRMCRRRLRSPETWYGDFLASMGAARLAERRLKEFCAKFGLGQVREYHTQWLDYSERMAAHAIAALPSGRMHTSTTMDAFPGIPDGLELQATIDVDADAGRVVVDLRDNPDCTPTGLNLSEASSRNSATTGILYVLNSHRDARYAAVPNNSGSHRRIEVLLRENCVVGIPRHPASCSVATIIVPDRVVAMVAKAFAQVGEAGMAEPCFGMPPWLGVVSGVDRQRPEPYILQLFSGTSGGPATSEGDGWLSFIATGGGGMAYTDSSETVEQKYPFVVWEKTLRLDSEGAGRWRGAPGNVSIYGPRFDPMSSHYMMEGVANPPKGVRGGGDALGPEAWVCNAAGFELQVHDAIGAVTLDPGEVIISLSAGGGGFGDAYERDPQHVLRDVSDGWISQERAASAYGVVVSGDPARREMLRVDEEATALLRTGPRAEPSAPRDDARLRHERTFWWQDPGQDRAG
jgi:N-methylhydantoinase B